jgi:hypothetical protein
MDEGRCRIRRATDPIARDWGRSTSRRSATRCPESFRKTIRDSAGFFRKLEFEWYRVYRDEQGYRFAQGRNPLIHSDQEAARKILGKHKVSGEW